MNSNTSSLLMVHCASVNDKMIAVVYFETAFSPIETGSGSAWRCTHGSTRKQPTTTPSRNLGESQTAVCSLRGGYMLNMTACGCGGGCCQSPLVINSLCHKYEHARCCKVMCDVFRGNFMTLATCILSWHIRSFLC